MFNLIKNHLLLTLIFIYLVKCYDPECLLKINDDLNELTCAVCFDRSPDTKLLPCGHDLFCKTCIFKVRLTQNNCPVCRSNIDQIIFL